MIPVRPPFFLPWIYPGLIWRMPATSKDIFLTFDDGPVPGPTDFVLDTLSKFSAEASFFCIGDNVKKHPEIFKKVISKGHAIGNHTFNHLNGWSTDSQRYIQNTTLCDEEFEKHGKSANLFRPPYGRVSRKQIAGLKKYHVIMWDVLTRDYDSSLKPESCLKQSINATRPGSIIVFHDSFKAEKNIRFVLPRYIEYFLEQGYQFKKIVL